MKTLVIGATGLLGSREFHVETQEPWQGATFEAGELFDVGDKVAAEIRAKMPGKASGASVPWALWQVITIRNGRALRSEWFSDRAGALEAAGVSQ